MTFSLTWLPAVLKAAGLKVVEQPGWQTRGHGDMGKVLGVLCHHTAGGLKGNAPSLAIVTTGRPDLAGPLAQLALGRDGTFYIVAAGEAWHAGRGEWQGVTSGNSHFIGIEAENTGLANDNPWPAVQLDAYARGCAAILKHVGAKPIMCAGHKEYALPKGRKPDPSFDMVAFRKKVAALMAGAPATPAPPRPAPPDVPAPPRPAPIPDAPPARPPFTPTRNPEDNGDLTFPPEPKRKGGLIAALVILAIIIAALWLTFGAS
jgi:hypothetical protein